MKFGVFTVCSPEYDIKETIALLKELGYDGVEWRVKEKEADTPENRRSHDPSDPHYPGRYWMYGKGTLDIDNIEEEAKEAKRLCDEAGLEIYGLSTYVPANETEKFKRVLEAGAAIGAPRVRVGCIGFDREKSGMNYPEAFAKYREDLKTIEGYARDCGTKAVIELHHGTLTPSASAAARALEGLDPKYIGVIFDPGNMVYEGYEDYRNGLEILGDFVDHVHVKNAALVPGERDEIGELHYVRAQKPFPDGSVDFRQLFSDLRAVGYDGTVCVEDFSNEFPTEEKLRQNIEFLRKL